MSGAINLSEYIKSNIDITISIVGSHVQALPININKEKSIDLFLQMKDLCSKKYFKNQ